MAAQLIIMNPVLLVRAPPSRCLSEQATPALAGVFFVEQTAARRKLIE